MSFNGKLFKKDVLVELDTGTGTIIAWVYSFRLTLYTK
jgi:hypothetical protein